MKAVVASVQIAKILRLTRKHRSPHILRLISHLRAIMMLHNFMISMSKVTIAMNNTLIEETTEIKIKEVERTKMGPMMKISQNKIIHKKTTLSKTTLKTT